MLKSTSIVGGASVLTIVLNLIRSKAIAVLLGPKGTGLIAVLQVSTYFIQNLAGLGIQNSAVRDIAQANTKDNQEKLSVVIKSVRKLVLITGLVGSILTLIFSKPLSYFTFSTYEYVFEIRLLSIAVFFNLIIAGQSALIQGMRRIKDLAKMSIFSTLMGTLLSLPLIYFYQFDGVSYYLVALAIGQFLVSFYFASKIKIEDVKVSWRKALIISKGMIRLGSYFMFAALFGSLCTYLVRAIIIKDFGLSDAGIYQAAVSISGLYIGVILEAMGKDFYPRLTSVAFQSDKENTLINEQIQLGIVLTAPGLMFTLALAPLAIKMLYSEAYLDSFPILQWMVLGVFLRTISWPMGFLFIARANGKIFLIVEVISSSLQVILTYLLLKSFGLVGAGIAFLLLDAITLTIQFFLTNKINGFRCSYAAITRILIISILFILSFLAIQNFSFLWGSITSLSIGILLSVFAIHEISKILGIKNFKNIKDMINRKM